MISFPLIPAAHTGQKKNPPFFPLKKIAPIHPKPTRNPEIEQINDLIINYFGVDMKTFKQFDKLSTIHPPPKKEHRDTPPKEGSINPQLPKIRSRTVNREKRNPTGPPAHDNKKAPTHKPSKDALEELKKKKHLYTIAIIPKNPSSPQPTYSFFVNYTYRRQIPLYMKHRVNWKFITDKKEEYHFRWKYYARKVKWKEYQKASPNTPNNKLKMINLFENYKEIGNKKNFFVNMLLYCEYNELNVFDYIPFSVILNKRQECFKLNIAALDKLIKMCNENYKQTKGASNFSTKIPYVSMFKIDGLEKKIAAFPSDDSERPGTKVNINKSFLSHQNFFIVKPINLYQGLGIKVTNKIDEVVQQSQTLFRGMEKVTSEMEEYRKKHPDQKVKHVMYKTMNILIQKYLDRPLLYNGRKFDIRIFVLVDHGLNVYLCREGHLKACSEEYSLDSNDQFSHITNYSLQKHCKKFSQLEYANEISYQQFKECLTTQLGSKEKAEEVFSSIILHIKDLIEISMNCVGKRLMLHNDTLSFQIFGYDFIIDQFFKPWILEINYNPGLQISSKVIERIVPRMVDDAFRLTIDKVFDTVYDSSCVEDGKYKTPYHVDGYTDEENIFEFICNINKSPYE